MAINEVVVVLTVLPTEGNAVEMGGLSPLIKDLSSDEGASME
jgi:hypothetical protein